MTRLLFDVAGSFGVASALSIAAVSRLSIIDFRRTTHPFLNRL
jgi:hypothetical protein